MLKKTVTFEDLDGNEVTEDFYFHLSKADIIEMEASEQGGMAQHLAAMIATNDNGQILSAVKLILERTVGRRSEDGRRFERSKEITEAFMQSDAYSVVFMDLVTDAAKAAEFFKGVIPAQAAAKLEASMASNPVYGHLFAGPADSNGQLSVEPAQPVKKAFGDYTDQELMTMSNEEFQALVGTDPRKMSKEQMVVGMRRMAQPK
jgi:hypothetical protein